MKTALGVWGISAIGLHAVAWIAFDGEFSAGWLVGITIAATLYGLDRIADAIRENRRNVNVYQMPPKVSVRLDGEEYPCEPEATR